SSISSMARWSMSSRQAPGDAQGRRRPLRPGRGDPLGEGRGAPRRQRARHVHRREGKAPSRDRQVTEEAGLSTHMDMKLEVIVIPVSDVDRAAEFYRKLGWRLDGETRKGDRRRMQFTPPGSPCSIIFGAGVTSAAPGSAQFLHLVVSDIVAARD